MEKKKTKVMTIPLNIDFYDDLTSHCKSIQQTKTGLVRQLLIEYLRKQKMQMVKK